MNQQAWYEHFKEQLQGLTESFEHSGAHGSLLKYALQEQRLQPEQYLTWAMSHYLLPKLQPRFFTETPISQEMFAKWATHYPWSEECLPVAEWDGAIIVACLQPPQDFPTNPASIFVLATPENLQEAWKSLHREKSAENKEAPKKTDFEPLELMDESPSEENILEGIADLNLAVQEEKPDGLFEAATVVQLKPVLESTFEAPEGKSSEISEPEGALIDENTISVIDPPSVAGSTTDKTIVATIPRPGQPAKPKQMPVHAGQFALDKFKAQNPDLISESVKKVLNEMKVHFQRSLILTMDEHETQLTVFAWDENFRGMKDTSMRISLDSPSIFSIVAKTQKPFHGYISLNEINEKFFEDWNQGQIPDHVTITPLILNDHMVGMILGIAEKAAYNKASLSFAEKLSEELVSTLKAA